jgi:hypothetical protein
MVTENVTKVFAVPCFIIISSRIHDENECLQIKSSLNNLAGQIIFKWKTAIYKLIYEKHDEAKFNTIQPAKKPLKIKKKENIAHLT